MTVIQRTAAAEIASTYATQKLLAAAVLVVLLAVLLAPVLINKWWSTRQVGKLDKDLAALPIAASAADVQSLREQRLEWRRRQEGRALGAIMGEDGRLSTSRAIAASWTLVIAYILLALLLVWPEDWNIALKNLQGPYLALLGGPIAAVVLSRTIVSTRVRRQTLQKPKGDNIPRLGDLVNDDSGDTDLFDMQYVLFNLIAMGFVLTAFSKATLGGFPDVPTALWLLTGGPAAVYVSNKAFGTNAPAIFSVDPARVRKNDKITVYGQNFTVADDATNVSVQINGERAEVEAGSVTSTSVRATVPPDLLPSDSAVITVITDAGLQTNRAGLLAVVQVPTVEPLAAGVTVAPTTTFTLTGIWTPGPTGLTVLINGVAASTSNVTANALNVVMPPGMTPGTQVDVVIIDAVGRSEPIKIAVS